MRITDENTYELVHSGLNALELTTANETGGSSMVGGTWKQTSPPQQTTLLTNSTMMATHDQSK